MREQTGINRTTFIRRASLPAEEREYSASRYHVGTRSGMHPEDRPFITSNRSYHAPTTESYYEIDEEGEEVSTRPSTRTSARRYDLTPFARQERRTEELPRQGKTPDVSAASHFGCSEKKENLSPKPLAF